MLYSHHSRRACKCVDAAFPSSLSNVLTTDHGQQIVSEAGKFQERMVDMFAQIGNVLQRFRIYQAFFHNHERLLYSLSNAYLEVLSFCTSMKNFLLRTRSSLRKFAGHQAFNGT